MHRLDRVESMSLEESQQLCQDTVYDLMYQVFTTTYPGMGDAYVQVSNHDMRFSATIPQYRLPPESCQF